MITFAPPEFVVVTANFGLMAAAAGPAHASATTSATVVPARPASFFISPPPRDCLSSETRPSPERVRCRLTVNRSGRSRAGSCGAARELDDEDGAGPGPRVDRDVATHRDRELLHDRKAEAAADAAL